MQDYSEFRPSKLWKKLSAERRTAAAELFWSDEQSTEQQIEAVSALAAHMKFRPKTLIGLPIERKAKYLATLPTIADTVAARALINYHLERQRPMMSAFLDLLGITHENGLISEENVVKPTADKLKAAAAELSSKYAREDVTLYFSTLISQDPDTWGGLVEFTREPAGKTG
ncbi:MAG: hypothetical protein ACJ731_14875 [Vicinamibacterales bacterium]